MLNELPIAELTDLVEAVAAPLLVVDLDSHGNATELLCNERCAALLPDLAKGRGMRGLPAALVAGLRCCASARAPIELPRLIEADGGAYDLELSPLAGSDGSVRRVVGTLTDHSIRETLVSEKDEAQRANRAKSDFLANMSHELRQPLNAIIGFSQIVVDQVFGPIGESRYLDYLQDIQFSGKHLLNIINDLLDISKNEAGRLSLIEQPTDLAEVVQASVRLVRDSAAVGGVTLVVDVPSEVPLIWADEQRLRQVVVNLLSNAVKFTPEGGEVAVKVASGQEGIAIVVRDTGIGMAEEDIPKALQPFGQIDSSLSRNHQGTGLGLPLSKALLDLHDATLSICSEPGGGTTVTAVVPGCRFVDGPAAGGEKRLSAGAA